MSKLYLAAIDYCQPEGSLPDGVLTADGLPNIRTALKAEYLRSTKNVDPYSVVENLECTPSELGATAVRKALSKCSRESSDLNLILGATCTPLQTIPVESQRIGKELGVKIPAYDINGGSSDLALHIETLLSWKAERVPEHTLSVSTHIPTSRVNYADSANMEELASSDGGGAAILSKEKGSYSIEGAKAELFPARSKDFSIELYGHLKIHPELSGELLVPKLAELFDSMKNQVSESAVIIESQLTPNHRDSLKEAIGGQYGWYSSWETLGNMFGATPYAALASFEASDEANGASQIVLLQSGIGPSVGIVILSKE